MFIDIPDFDKDYLPAGYVRMTGKFEGMICREGYLHLTDDEKKKICNGIGAADGISSKIPSTIWLLDCSETGNVHDYDYHVGGTAVDRDIADKVFLHNLRVQIGKGTWWLKWLRNDRAKAYYVTLRVAGQSHFNYNS